jgi:hypothetical protein
MKIRLDIDATPQELRTFFGLPDLGPFHDEMIKQLQMNMAAGAEGYDPLTLMNTVLPQGMQGLEAMQKLFWESMRRNFDMGPGQSKDQR